MDADIRVLMACEHDTLEAGMERGARGGGAAERRGGEWWRRWGVAIVMLSLLATTAFAQTDGTTESQATMHYRIPAQSLNTALRDFALASGLQVSFPDDVAAGRTSRELVGTYTPEEALSELLAGTGLSFRFTAADTVTLERARRTAVPVVLTANGTASAAPTTGPDQPASTGARPVKVPEIIVLDVQERNLPDQEAVKEVAGTVNVVTREEIQRARPKNADEMLRRIPGPFRYLPATRSNCQVGRYTDSS